MFSTPRRRRFGWLLLSLCAVAIVLSAVAGIAFQVQTAANTERIATEVRDTQLEGTPLGKQLLASSERVLDCTSPDGQCFKDGQERTAKAVGDINRVIVLAAACSVGLDKTLTVDERQAEIQTCVIDRLAQRAAKP